MKLKILFVALLGVVPLCSADDSDPYRRTWVLDDQGNYVLEWSSDFEQSRIHFNVTVKTRGYVGFGLSKKGLTLGADIIIGGVHPNHTSYFADRHGLANEKTGIDASQDWTLDSAWESKTHTFLSFSRQFETCDKANDLAITNDVIHVLWSYGERDNPNENPYQNRGSVPLYLLDPDLTPNAVRAANYRNVTRPQPIKRLGDWKVWSIPVDMNMPARDTTQQCTFHKAPAKSKQHIVGFRPVLDQVAKRHLHHFMLHICYAPKGVSPDLLFGRLVGGPGEECYNLFNPQNRIPTQYCQEIRHVFAIGGNPIFYPEHVGVPLSETHDEYYMLQSHYDNPEERAGIKVHFELEFYYTNKLRKYDSGLLFTGVATAGSPSILIPPRDPNHFIYGHCAADCTRKIIPKTGIQMFAGMLHTHFTAKGMRATLLQDAQEKAMLTDDNYNPSHQPVRTLREERTVYPGDMIVNRCIYDTSNRTGVTVGGFKSRDEMCNTIFWYYPYIRNPNGEKYTMCSGELKSDAYRNTLQIFQSAWSDEKREEVITSPPKNAGLTVSEAMNRVNWDIDLRTQVQTHQRFLPQVTKCKNVAPDAVTQELLGQTGYPGLSPLRRYVKTEERRDLGRFSDVQKEIQDPENEFIYLWPKDITFYSPPTICPK